MKIPEKVLVRFSTNVSKFKRVLIKAQERDVNESDTVAIVTDILAEIFGYDKYDEITSEYAIKSTFCDLAIKINNKVRFLIEVKAIGIDLRENHLNQALAYGAKEGIDWIILTNGILWEIYKVTFKTNLAADLLCKLTFLDINLKSDEDKNTLFILCKEGLSKEAISEFHEKQIAVNKFMISAIFNSDSIVNSVRLQLKKVTPDIKVTNEEVLKIINDEIIKRDVLSDEHFNKAKSKLKRTFKPKS